jgi:7-carboxy-7-deazaguanine synthase
MAKGYVSEIFSSLQGEGIHVGERQIFIRLAGCPWRCRYCDTPGSLSAESGEALSVEDVLDRVHHLREERPHRTASLTGGEPLSQAEFLSALLPALRRLGLRTYLETSGTMPEALRRVVGECDVVAMDIKLPSAAGRPFWEEHREFLSLAGGRAFVKLVLTDESTQDEFEASLRLLAAADPVPALILQPVTAVEDLESRLKGGSAGPVRPPPPHRIIQWWELARQRLPDVRLVPQMHPVWGLP